jgi:hypothetical protein
MHVYSKGIYRVNTRKQLFTCGLLNVYSEVNLTFLAVHSKKLQIYQNGKHVVNRSKMVQLLFTWVLTMVNTE